MSVFRLALLICAGLALYSNPGLSAEEPWVEEAIAEAGVADPVRDATIDYGRTGDLEATQVVFEGTLERFPYGHRQPTLICAPPPASFAWRSCSFSRS